MCQVRKVWEANMLQNPAPLLQEHLCTAGSLKSHGVLVHVYSEELPSFTVVQATRGGTSCPLLGEKKELLTGLFRLEVSGTRESPSKSAVWPSRLHKKVLPPFLKARWVHSGL